MAKKTLYDRMVKEGYETVSDFYRATKIPLAFETVRRAINDNQPVNAHSFMLIARYLGFKPEEIKDILKNPAGVIVEKDYRAAKIFSELIGNSPDPTPRDMAVISLSQKIRTDDEAWKQIMDACKLVCRVAGIDIEDELKMLKRG